MSEKTFSRIFKSAFDQPGDGKFYKLPAGLGEVKDFQMSAMVTVNDVADIDSATMLDEVLGLARPQYVLAGNACRIIPSDTLEFSVDIATKLSAQEKVPDLVEPDLKKLGWTRVAFDLWKNQVHVAIGDKAARRASHNVLQLSIEDAAGAIAASKNSQIATALNGGTRTGAGGNWTSTTNPYDDIATAITSIEDTYEAGEANTLIAPRPVWTAFFGNAYVKGQLEGVKFPATKIFPVPGLPGFTGVLDNNITAAAMVVCDKNKYVLMGQGPVEAEGYRNSAAGFDAWVIRDWMQPQRVVNDAGYVLTALLT